jgi:hypothetical protein
MSTMSTMSSTSLHVQPPIAELRRQLRAPSHAAGAELLGRPIEEWRRHMRRELGLATDAPVIMSGHQPAFWHPGILIKSLLVERLAQGRPGCAAHVVVEQDVEPLAAIAAAWRDDADALQRGPVDLLRQPPGVAVCRVRSFEPADIPPRRWALPSIETGLRRIHDALVARRSEPNAAWQVTSAAFDLLAPTLSPPTLLSPHALLQTELARELLRHLASDPESAARCYNAALGDGGIAAPLQVLRDRVEVPLWRLDEDGRRLRAWDDDLDRFRAGEIQLLPRALLMTGLLRTAACDLFIHGLGGMRYDRAMEGWFAAWLGSSVAPAGLATATVTLPFTDAERPHLDLDEALREWRRTWFDPESLSQGATPQARPGPMKQRRLMELDQLPRRSLQRRRAWRAMHAELELAREGHTEALRQRLSELSAAREQARVRPILREREWAFPLHPLELPAALQEALERLE